MRAITNELRKNDLRLTMADLEHGLMRLKGNGLRDAQILASDRY